MENITIALVPNTGAVFVVIPAGTQLLYWALCVRVHNSYHIDTVSALHVICLLNFMLFFWLDVLNIMLKSK